MRKRRITALVMALVLGVAAFSGCGKKDADSKYKVYYVNEDQGEILAESFLPSEEKTSTMVDEMTDKLNKKNAEILEKLAALQQKDIPFFRMACRSGNV